MLDLMTPDQKYDYIISLLNDRQLKKSIDELFLYAKFLPDNTMDDAITDMAGTYKNMLYYAHEDIPDPERHKIFGQLVYDAYMMADRIRDILDTNYPSIYYSKRSDILHQPYRSISDYQLMLEAYVQDNALHELLNEKEKRVETMKYHETIQKEMFNRIWVSGLWNDQDKIQADSLMNSDLILEEDKALFVTAVTFNLLHSPDETKLLFLLQQRNRSEAIVRIRAIVGFALIFYLYKNRVPVYSKVVIYLSILEPDDKKALTDLLTDIQLSIVNTLETKKISKIIQDDILPQLLQAGSIKLKGDFGIISDDDIFDEDKNPEWSDKKRKKLEDKLNKMSEWQIEGKDTNYITFSHMKSGTFYKEISNWLLPFDINTSYVDHLLENIKDSSLIKNFLVSKAILCDSDRYSLCFLIDKADKSVLHMMIENLKMKEEEIKSLMEDGQYVNNKNNDIIRNYLQDLYRFFHIFADRIHFDNPFHYSLNLIECSVLKPLFISYPDRSIEIAGQYMNIDRFRESYKIYSEVIQLVDGKAENFQKMGFSCQKLEFYDEALEWYLRADFAKPENFWTIQHIAQCYRLKGDLMQAIKYYSEIENMTVNSPNILIAIGECYLMTKDYDNALKRLFEAQFKYPKSIKVLRSLAWATLAAGKYEQSYNFYMNILGFEYTDFDIDPTIQDYLNAGHSAWLCKKRPEAIKFYIESYKKCEKEDDFMKQMNEDEPYLIKGGIDHKDFIIMKEIIREFAGSQKKIRKTFQ